MMENILVIGAGRSTQFLVNYLLRQAEQANWRVTLADHKEAALKAYPNHELLQKKVLDISNLEARNRLIAENDVVISMLPSHLHYHVAQDCVNFSKHLLTASYLSDEMLDLSGAVEEKNLLFLKEMGLDPGIDHMSAMSLIHELKAGGAIIKSFRSYTGGLVAPECDDNPWHYKISWNPMNVVKAGQGTAWYMENGKVKLVPYQHLFKRTAGIEVPGYGHFEGYYNRNSLVYRNLYDLTDPDTLIRGTLRRPGFCRAWDQLVSLGLTNDEDLVPTEGMTYRELTGMLLPDRGMPTTETLARYLSLDIQGREMEQLNWLGILDDEPVPLDQGTAARALKNLLVKRMKMDPHDRDLIVMVHYIDYETGGKSKSVKSYLTMEGQDGMNTAMAKTVGAPLAIAATLLMKGKLPVRGIRLPVDPLIYVPVLKHLEDEGIRFRKEYKN